MPAKKEKNVSKETDVCDKKTDVCDKKTDVCDKKTDVCVKKTDVCVKETVKNAITALKLMHEKVVGDLKKQPLLEDTSECPVFLQLMLKKIPPKKLLKMIRVPLPHSLIAETSEVCLITGDLEKRNHKAEIEPTVLHYKDLLKKHGVTRVSEVIPLRQLRTEYKTFESKRQLAGAYDVFLVDKKIAGVLPKTLGKPFFHSRKFPIQIDMRMQNLKEQIDRALCQTEFLLTCRGNCYALEIARLSMEDDAIMENISTTMAVLANKLPGKDKNILGLYLKTARSKSIPIYVSLDTSPEDIFIKTPRRFYRYKRDELSTMDDAEVKVFWDGRVILQKKKKSSNCEDAAESDKEIDLNEAFSDSDLMESEEDTQESISNEGSSKKKRKYKKDIQDSVAKDTGKKKKKTKKTANLVEVTTNTGMENEDNQDSTANEVSLKKMKKTKKTANLVEVTTNTVMENEDNQDSTANEVSLKKKKKGKKSANFDEAINIVEMENEQIQDSVPIEISSKKRKKGNNSVLVESAEMKSEDETQKTPLGSKRNKKAKRESTENTTSDSMLSNVKKANVDSDINNSLVKLSKRRKSNRKSISVL